MISTDKKILILLGGMWHDFEGFAEVMTRLLEGQGCAVQATFDFDCLTRLEEMRVDVVLQYTSLSKHQLDQPASGPEGMTDAQVDGLQRWVQAGGGLLAVHSATVTGTSNPRLGELLGGEFVSHPPQFAFTVYPLNVEHPILEGIEAFTVHDEFYIERLVAPVQLLMVALDRGLAHPMAWCKMEGRGRVAHLAMGHSSQVWNMEPYRRLILQAMDWVTHIK